MNLNPLAKYYTKEHYLWSALALSVGCAIVYFGDRLLGVRLEINFGMSTYSPLWILDLILVPFISGLAVSFIYGLGGKILAHFPPLVMRSIEFYTVDSMVFPDGVSVLPVGFWILVVIVCVESASAGGFVGEVIIKRTYGRRPRHLVHKRYQTKDIKVD
ncbi:MAG TPA: hypothetical protein ENK06_04285 [Gammaproteobacteria bacterium]|nr:hypothetical protein [Gammaproteobacteria bacterium]